MADNKVKFLRGTAAEYEASTKDNDVFYYTTDTKKLYLGANEVTGSNITVDNTLSDTSESPVQNKIIKAELDKKAEKSIYSDNSINLGRKADTITGTGSITMGTDVEASGIHAHAEGSASSATGNYAFAGGIETEVKGNVSFAYGEGLKTSKYYSAAFGIYNLADENTLFSIGNGDSDTERSNAFEITKTGGKLHNKNIITIDDVATQSANGLMSAADKKKIDGMVSGNEGYQMPYYVQSGTISVGSTAYNGVKLTFPKAFLGEPILLLGATVDSANGSLSVIANYKELTKDGFTLFARRFNSNGITSIGNNTPAVIGWVALGKI